MGRDGGLNRTALAFVAKNDLHFAGRARLRSMLLPWTEVCASESGWGWNLDAKSFEQSVLDEIRWVRDPATGCGQPPSAAATMTTPVLRDYVNRCHSPRNFMSTANLSVPVFQLALFLREFPDSHYSMPSSSTSSSSSRACQRKRYGGYLRLAGPRAATTRDGERQVRLQQVVSPRRRAQIFIFQARLGTASQHASRAGAARSLVRRDATAHLRVPDEAWALLPA
eukprot:scaffold756_cov75-Phaeocystis_antarctica.AAC.2